MQLQLDLNKGIVAQRLICHFAVKAAPFCSFTTAPGAFGPGLSSGTAGTTLNLQSRTPWWPDQGLELQITPTSDKMVVQNSSWEERPTSATRAGSESTDTSPHRRHDNFRMWPTAVLEWDQRYHTSQRAPHTKDVRKAGTSISLTCLTQPCAILRWNISQRSSSAAEKDSTCYFSLLFGWFRVCGICFGLVFFHRSLHF